MFIVTEYAALRYSVCLIIACSSTKFNAVQCIPYITQLIITQIWIYMVKLWLPDFFLPWNFTKELYKVA